MNNVFNRDAIIAEMATRHGIVLSRYDPVFSVIAVHGIILEQYQELLSNSLEDVQFNLDAIYDRHSKAVRDNAQHYVTQSLNALMQEHGKIQERFAGMLAEERKAFSGVLNAKVGILQKWMWVSIGSGSLSVMGLLGTILFLGS